MKAKREKPFHLDMPFDKALRRYAQTDAPNLRRRKRRQKTQSAGVPPRLFFARASTNSVRISRLIICFVILL